MTAIPCKSLACFQQNKPRTCLHIHIGDNRILLTYSLGFTSSKIVLVTWQYCYKIKSDDKQIPFFARFPPEAAPSEKINKCSYYHIIIDAMIRCFHRNPTC